ncbi:MAG: diguanylate cyclase [Candidatus Marinarcus sp.]|uniref:diguanylate cyclase n=1 Tax=Candidatus Marinarcus sp. TaxID=3100987 RepID=UPI003AFFFFBC
MSGIEDCKFIDLVNVSEFEQLLESFYKATGIPNGLVDIDGQVIIQAGWTEACAKFHRVNEEAKLSCIQSDISLMKNMCEGEVNCALCKNGLVDYATPIVLEGKQLATLFLGQVLNKEPNMEFFSKQAKKYHYDETSYLQAISRVPVVEKKQMESLMDCVVKMAHMLAMNGLSKFREASLKHDLNENKEQKIHLKDILDSSPVGIGWSSSEGKIEYLNHQFTQLFGYTIEDIPTLDVWFQKAYPNKEYRETVIETWHKKIIETTKKKTFSPELEVSVTCKDGSSRQVFIRVSWLNGLRLASYNDITAHWESELRNRAHDAMLELVAKNAPLNEILNSIVKTIESEETHSQGSILLLDKEGKRLLTGAAPSLPKFYNDAINGLEIGIGVGSCGTAAFTKKRVIVKDIMTHEYWKPYKKLAKKAGLASCWSEPIISSSGKVLGTFAIYHGIPTLPNANDIERIHFAANLAAIAIDNRNTHLELEERAYTDFLTNLPNRRYFIEHAELEWSRHKRHGGKLSLIMFDIDHFKKFNDTYGHSIGDLVLQKIAEISKSILRDIDLIGRIGGEEFAILLPQTDIEEAVKIAERLRIAISKGVIVLENREFISNFKASFGVVSNYNDMQSIDELLINADDALYDAKEAGRNRVCVFKGKK